MTTALRTNHIQDEYERPVPGASIYVYNADNSLAALTSNGTTSIANPLTSDAFGNYSYYALVGYYREDVWFGGKLRWSENNVAVGSPGADLTLRSDLTKWGLLTVTPQQFGAVADGATDDKNAIQAAIAFAAATGSHVVFPAGVYGHTGLTFANKVQYRGAGRDTGSTKGTVLLYTGTGDGVQLNNPINSSTAANVSIEGITFKNATRTAGKGSLADTGSTDLRIRQCAFMGSDRGLILDQSELVTVEECDFEISAASAVCGLWIVNGSDRTVSATADYTNQITVKNCQFNGSTTAYGVVDDGGGTHAFENNNYNGCVTHLRFAGVAGLKISGGEFESSTAACITFNTTTLLGTGAGACTAVWLGGGAEIVPTAGQACVTAFSLTNIVIDGVYFGNTSSAKFTGTSNVNAIYSIGAHNAGGGATFDGQATNHWEVGYNGTDFKVRTNMAYSWGGTTIINASGVLQAAGFPALTGDVTSAGGSLATTLAAATVVAKVAGQALAPASTAIGGGTALTKCVVYTPTLTPVSVAAATIAEQTFTVTGLTTADTVIVNPPAIGNSTGIAGVRVSAADTLAIRFDNPTAGALTPSSGTYRVLAVRS